MKMSRNKQTLLRVFIAAVLLLAGMVLAHFVGKLQALTAFIPAYLIVGYDIIIKAVKNIARGQVFDENFLMLIASLGAFVIGESPEAVAVLLLYQVGEVFQRYAVNKSRSSITSLMSLRPDVAHVLVDGEEIDCEPDEVALGSEIVVRPGERIPLDGEVASGEGYIDNSALTGESEPVLVNVGSAVLSGGVSVDSVLKIRTTTEYYDSTVSRILELAENAVDKKAKAESLISKFALVYTPVVVILALLVCVIPPIFLGDWLAWLKVGLTFLVVSCPCAIVISVPLAFFSGIGGASSVGVLIKGGNYVEMLAKAKTFALDKTGTITVGKMVVASVYPEQDRDRILRLAAVAESGSNHPIARAIRGAVEVDATGYSAWEVAGKGVIASKRGEEIAVGNEKLMRSYGINVRPENESGTVVYVALNGELVGAITVADAIKEGSASAVSELRKKGGRVIILSGDGENTVKSVAEKVGITEYYANLLPSDKVERLEYILSDDKSGVVAFVGDGINDAPSIVRADVGIAMGAIGSDSAIEAADAVLMYDDLGAIVKARKICKKTVSIAKQNIIFSLAVKIGIMILSLVGFANMWLAVIGDVGVAMIAILNSLRAGKTPKNG